MERIIGLLDLDYFFAQCELLRAPQLKGRPVVIVMPSLRENSGAIATCNYEARALKIRSGMSLSLAKKLADSQTVFINADRPYYAGLSQRVFSVLDSFSEKVEQVSIDEAYFDLSNPEGYARAEEIAKKIKYRIFTELGLTCSIGLGPNKLISKMACSVKKPNGFFVVKPSEIDSFLGKQKIGALFGVGPKSEEEFKKHGVFLVSDIKKFSLSDLVSWFGEANGTKFYDFAFGRDERVIEVNRESQQLSRMITMKEDSKDFEFIKQNIDFLSSMLFDQIVQMKKEFKTVSLIIVTNKMETLTKSKTKDLPIGSIEELKEIEYDLLRSFLDETQVIVRRVGIRASNFGDDSGFQQKLFVFK